MTIRKTDKTLFANTALLPDGWAENVVIEVNTCGTIAAVHRDQNPPESAQRYPLLIPAPTNLHSHAFQRAMAGLTERRGPDQGPGTQDSFWTWRRLMFRFLDQLTPNDVQAITAFVQMEMAEAGYGASVEFHYLHHQPGGRPFDDPAELSARIAAAAQQSGLGLTLLPVLYEVGGCDRRALGPGQIRFGHTPEGFAQTLAGAQNAVKQLPADAMIGLAPHSLRAVTPEGLHAANTLLATLPDAAPIHMHLAEQVAEVEETTATYGARPVEYLIDNIVVNARWCLIHCTQMQPHETRALAQTDAVAGLCPITESSLGDGIFDGVNFLAAGGRIGIGSDSNIRISLSEELRTLEYSQRLRDKARATLATREKSTARRVFDAVCAGGAQAAGRACGAIAPGKIADLTALNMHAPQMAARRGDALLDSFVFAGDDRLVTDVWSAGRHIVKEGRHRARATLTDNYIRTLSRLKDVM